MSSKGKRKRRKFSEEFKRDAVNLVVVEGYTIAAAARAVGVLDGSLREWHRSMHLSQNLAARVQPLQSWKPKTNVFEGSFETQSLSGRF